MKSMHPPLRLLPGLLVAGALLAGATARPAAFQNLDFESPHLPLVPDPMDIYWRVPVANALPHWTVYVGTSVESLAHYNNAFLNTAGAALRGPGEWPGIGLGLVPRLIEGNYSALLQCGAPFGHPGQPSPSSASLAQTGLVPPGTLSVFMSIDAYVPFSVSLGGQQLGLVTVQQTPTHTVFGADVSAFANQEAEFRITTAAQGFGSLWIDSIQFSPLPVPEPGPLALLAGGLAAFGLLRWLRRASGSGASSERRCSSAGKP